MILTQKFTTKELDDGIDLTYFGARWYDQDLGVWTSADPARQFHSGYSYDANPLNAFDPNGKESIVLNSPRGADGFGHSAIIIGDDRSGWTYFSKDGYGDQNQRMLPFKTLSSFYGAQDPAKDKGVTFGDRYTRRLALGTSREQDQNMVAEGTKIYMQAYGFIKNNCSDLVGSIMAAAGLKAHNEGNPTIPNKQFSDIKTEVETDK